MFEDYLNLSYAYGTPLSKGILKSIPEDFVVHEVPLFQPNGEGEHLFLYIEKKNLNTLDVAHDIAEKLDLGIKDISYAGLKDKQAITRQWFSAHCPGNESIDTSVLVGENWKLLDARRNLKKLKTGVLKGNRFSLIIRSISHQEEVEKRLHLIRDSGVPNYFTAQRFGRGGNNLHQAHRMLLEGKRIKNRFLTGMYFSAIRSYLFNKIVSYRIEQGLWQQIVAGDVINLNGSRSLFVADSELPSLVQRLHEHDISPSAILWGRGDQLAINDALLIQNTVLSPFEPYLQAMIKQKAERAYRSIHCWPEDLQWSWINEETLKLQFYLPSGNYATALMREVINYDIDISE